MACLDTLKAFLDFSISICLSISCHMWKGNEVIRFGIYACSPEDSSFKATFTSMEITECKWLEHEGQKQDK